MQEASGVIDTLESLPLYESYAGDYEQIKEAKIYKLWVRPTIPWKLECELPRSEAIELIEGSSGDYTEIASGDKKNRMVAIFLIISTVICLIGACCFEQKEFKVQVACYAALFAIQLLCIWMLSSTSS